MAEKVREVAIQRLCSGGRQRQWPGSIFLLEDDGTLYVNEINTLPGFTSISMYPKLWGLSGLCRCLILCRIDWWRSQELLAMRDVGSSTDGIKSWLAELGS